MGVGCLRDDRVDGAITSAPTKPMDRRVLGAATCSPYSRKCRPALPHGEDHGFAVKAAPIMGAVLLCHGQTTMPSDLRWFTAVSRALPVSSHISGPQMAARLPLFGMILRVAE